ncbi:hypothetical protein ACFQV2_10345 [Actinokineospora soli]|uniref:CARDB protein n=1 Tax=Actinokineospora soli TaxID=1048753 RepID=A0ABW2TMY1_9PSEU
MRARLLLLLVALALVAPATATATTGAVAVEIGAVNLDGPAVSTVEVTVRNGGPSRMTRLGVSFTGPVGWTSSPPRRRSRTPSRSAGRSPCGS